MKPETEQQNEESKEEQKIDQKKKDDLSEKERKERDAKAEAAAAAAAGFDEKAPMLSADATPRLYFIRKVNIHGGTPNTCLSLHIVQTKLHTRNPNTPYRLHQRR